MLTLAKVLFESAAVDPNNANKRETLIVARLRVIA